MVNRILIIGISAAGKTYLSNMISNKLKLPIVHLDSIFWEEDWKERKEEQVRSLISAELSKEKWIIEGYIEPLSTERIDRAEVIVYLDIGRFSAALNVLKRFVKHRKNPRPEMLKGNIDSFSLVFLWTILMRKERVEIEKIVSQTKKSIVVLKSRREINQFLKKLV